MLTPLLTTLTQSPHLVIFPAMMLASLIGALLIGRLISRPVAARPTFFNAVPQPNQIDYVSRVAFKTQPVMSRLDAQALDRLQHILADADGTFRAQAHVCLAEVLRPDPTSALRNDVAFAQRSLRDKRVDLAVFDAKHTLCLAILYQGAEDPILRQALTNANVPVLEIKRGTTAPLLRKGVLQHLGRAPQQPEPRLTAPQLQVVSA